MAHRCPNGSISRLIRNGPVGTMTGVFYTCPNCTYRKSARTILAETRRAIPAIVARLSA